MRSPPRTKLAQPLSTAVWAAAIALCASSCQATTSLSEAESSYRFGIGGLFRDRSKPFAGVNVDWDRPTGSPTPEMLKRAHVRSVRYVLKLYCGWCKVQDPGARLERYVENARQLSEAGIESLIVLNYETVPTHSSGRKWTASRWDSYIRRFADDVRRFAPRFIGMRVVFEIWNEQDHKWNESVDENEPYDPYVPPNVFQHLVSETTQAIRSAGAFYTVCGGLDSGDPTYYDVSWLHSQDACDAVGVHPYWQRPTSDPIFHGWGWGNLNDFLPYYLAVLRKPLWITETGTDDLNVQTTFVPQTMLTAYEHLFVERAHVYAWSDEMVDNFGLFDRKGVAKPVYQPFVNANANFLP